MATPWAGCWQVVYEDANEEIIAFRPTTVSLRRSGFSLFTAGHGG